MRVKSGRPILVPSWGVWAPGSMCSMSRYTVSKRCPGEMRRGVLADSKVLDTVAVSLRYLGGVWFKERDFSDCVQILTLKKSRARRVGRTSV